MLKNILGKVLEYVAFTGSMEHATNYGSAHDEVRAAMESVFPVSMLSRFLTLPVEEKQTQMEARKPLYHPLSLADVTLSMGCR